MEANPVVAPFVGVRRRHQIAVVGGGGLALLGVLQKAYEIAYVDTTRRPFVDKPKARPSTWALDMRASLSHGDILAPVADAMITQVLRPRRCLQVVGYGYGAFPLLGAIAARGSGIRLAMLRPTAKSDGLCKLIEGELDSSLPVVIVDDLVNSGKTVRASAEVLRSAGYTIAAATCVFQYEWGRGSRHPRQVGTRLVPLAKLRKWPDDL
jgi:orotate phosphoribosyltransferase